MKLLTLLPFIISMGVSQVLPAEVNPVNVLEAGGFAISDFKRQTIPFECHSNADCVHKRGHLCYGGFCVPTANCINHSDCGGGYCNNGICVADPPRLDSRQLICHNNAECDGGYCYNGICIADPPPPRPPQLESRQLICHNDAECEGGYCYNGICIADPPPPRPPQLESRKDVNCHNDAECEGGYCYNGICIADPPPQSEAEISFIPFQCRKNSDCKRPNRKFCVMGFCARRPPPQALKSRQDPSCHNDAECQGGYCYHGICIADPPAPLE